MIDDKTTAIHEAGHAVAFVRLWESSRSYGGISIIPDHENDTLGTSRAEELTWPADAAPSESELLETRKEWIYSCAGYAALIAAGYSEDEASEGCESDFESVPGEQIEDAKAEAVRLLKSPENIAAVRRVAAELSERKQLTGLQVETLVEVADGIETEESCQRYFALCARGGA